MGMLERLFGNVGAGYEARYANVRPEPFQRVLSINDLWQSRLETAAGQILCPARAWTRIGEFVIPPQQEVLFGVGNPVEWQNQGYLHVAIWDNTATNSVVVEGVVRLRQMNANETMIIVIYEGRTEVLRGDVNDKMRMIALPAQNQTPPNLTVEDCKMTLDLMPDTVRTIVRTPIGTAGGRGIWNLPVSVFE